MLRKICVLIPSYNESKTIGQIVRQLKDKGLVAYVVDDGSSDETSSIANGAGARVIRHEKNKGKGESLRDGFKQILKDGFDAVLVMDGDGQHRVEEIGHFIKMMEETDADMIIGNRMLDTSSMPYIRAATNRFMSNIISRISGQSIPDSQCGFRLIKRNVLENIELESSKYEIESELILKASKKNFKIKSVPITTVYKGETSNINPILDTIRFITLITKVISRG